MPDNEVKIQITSDQSGLQSGMSQAAGAVKDGLSNMQSTFAEAESAISGSTTAMMSKLAQLGPAALAAAGTFAAFEIAKSSIEAFTSYAGEVERLSMTLGVATEAASGLAVGLHILGMSSEEYLGIVMRMERQIKADPSIYDDLGIAIRDVNTKAYLPTSQILDNVIEKMKEYRAGTDQIQFAMDTMKTRNVAAVIELLHMKEAMALTTPILRDLGLELSGPDTDAARQFGMQGRILGEVWNALKIHIGQELMPTLQGLMGSLVEIGGVIPYVMGVVKAFVTVWEGLSLSCRIAGAAIVGTLLSIGNIVAAVAKGVMLVVKGDFAGAWNAMKDGARDAQANMKATNDMIVGEAEKTAKRLEQIWMPTKKLGQGEKTSGEKPYTPREKGTEKSRMPEWQAELKQREVAESAYFGLSIDAEKAYWEEKLALATKGTDEYREVQNKINELILKQGKEGVQADLESLKEQTRNTKLSWDDRLMAAQQIVDKMGSIYGEDSVQYKRAVNDKTKVSNEQEKQITQVAVEELKAQERDTMASWAARRAAATQATAIIADQYGKSSVEYQRALNEETKLAQDQAKDEIAIAAKKIQDEIKLNDDAAKSRQKTLQFQLSMGQITVQEELAAEVEAENARFAKEQELINKLKALYPELSKSWQAAMDQMTLATQKHDEKVTDDSEKAAQKMKQDIDGIVSPIVGSFGNMAKQIANHTFTIQQAFLDLANTILNTMIGVMEKVATNAITNMIMEQIGVTTAKKTEAVSAITADAAMAAAGAASSQASIPYVGPALAAAAAAETYGMVMAYVPLAIAEGGWDVDRGGLSMIHSKEMVLPADLAEGVRGMVRGGGRSGSGSAGTVINNNIQSWDSRDLGQFMKRNGRAMLTSLAYSARAWGVR